jgi:hypothetical protein
MPCLVALKHAVTPRVLHESPWPALTTSLSRVWPRTLFPRRWPAMAAMSAPTVAGPLQSTSRPLACSYSFLVTSWCSPVSPFYQPRAGAHHVAMSIAAARRRTWAALHGPSPSKLRQPTDAHEPRDAPPPLPRCRQAPPWPEITVAGVLCSSNRDRDFAPK